MNAKDEAEMEYFGSTIRLQNENVTLRDTVQALNAALSARDDELANIEDELSDRENEVTRCERALELRVAQFNQEAEELVQQKEDHRRLKLECKKLQNQNKIE
eukprot:CAMPEP_0197307530 /NCGR_PEP_ID=MMETSP0891-20130614/5316_1 /TAXON_ID=44058 ORGANISM="Aureoumbra lagunensis, Strain CCMP1510" /NCGR_SAMPLE_ID=MMETSP0891 /ASSEMBLY_ACC=CAM_ASM_000534 /LENGTH=102 /DNA_ID=CAMNT_0042790991 /DNA_START=487 /DNA_END=795 /DNA_ORIENTATION=+